MKIRFILETATLAAVVMLCTIMAVIILASSPVRADCIRSWCAHGHAGQPAIDIAPGSRAYLLNNSTPKQKVGDLYNPGVGGRIQIRNNQRQILGYIEPDGTITDSRRREVGSIGGLIE